MKSTKVSLNKLPAKVICPTSKSYAARCLILAALNPKDIVLVDLPQAQDTLDMMRVLKTLGINFLTDGRETKVLGQFPVCEVPSNKNVKINLGEGGTTIRFLLPFLSLGKNQYELEYEGRMLERPMDELYSCLLLLGVGVEKHDSGILLKGPVLKNKKAKIDCLKSSQFASAFELISSALSREQLNCVVDFENLALSIKYYELTQSLVALFSKQERILIKADFSSLGYFICHSVLRGSILVENIFEIDPLQADAKIFEALDQIGVNYQFSNDGLFIEKLKKPTCGFEIDGSKCIDLVPSLFFLASYLPFESIIRNIDGLIYKESDRLNEMIIMMKKFKIDYIYNKELDYMTVLGGNSKVSELSLMVAEDHRMVMVGSLFLKMNSGGDVAPYNCVKKSFPQFFDYFS
jgi:3-phosphoshikimate 1-carboxyvinyltransferase